MAFLDTDLLVGLLRGSDDSEAKLRELEASGEALKVTSVTAYELLKGANSTAKRDTNLDAVRRLLRVFTLVCLDSASCEEAARLYAGLRRSGTIIGEFDILIAGTVMASDDRLVTRDGHFRAVRGLKTEGW